MKTRRGYVYGPCGQVHYRTYRPDAAGSLDSANGAPVLVLSHQSPSSSLMYEAAYPLLAAAGIVCIGVDTPGFGYCDVPDPRPSVLDYASVFAPVLDHFDLDWGGTTPDGRLTVFVPSVPTPLAGAVYIIDRARVHMLDIPFTDAIRSISRWGAGSKDLVAAMRLPGSA
jgi:hypothetical protein